MRDLIQNKSMIELFNDIDNITNNNDENDTIVKKLVDKIWVIFKNGLNSKRKTEDKARKVLFESYNEYLNGYLEIITKQKNIIETMRNEPFTFEMSQVFIDMQKELDEYSMKKYNIESTFISKFLNKNECDIYRNIRVYDLLEKYFKNIKTISKNKIQTKEISNEFLDWKNYYYLVICMQKENELNQTILLNYVSRKKHIDENQFLVSKNSLYVSDFQGQLSKCVFYRRKRLKLTQADLSRISGVDRSMIAKIEKVKQPTTLETAIKLLSALNVRVAICPYGSREQKPQLQIELQK